MNEEAIAAAIAEDKHKSTQAQMTFGFGLEESAWSPKTMEALILQGKFHSVKQPILRLKDERIVAYEFLSRSSIPGSTLPKDFLQFSLEHGILTIADLHCLNNCVNAAQSVSGPLRRHINLYPSTLARVPLGNILRTFPACFERGAYCIELNESSINDPSVLIEPIGALKRAGVHIAIDDIGFGYSCLESLLLLEPDILKIDKKLVIGVARDEKRIRSLKRLLRVAESLQAEAIAEGIETQEDLDALKTLGVKYGQGFLWGHPA